MNKQIAQSVYAAFAVGDVPSVLATMDDKVEWIAAEGFPLAGTYIGPQDGARAHACWRQAQAFLAARRDGARP